jgi:hypothetical protein
MKLILLLTSFSVFTGCATGHCRKAQQPMSGSEAPATGTLNAAQNSDLSPDKHVLVYRYDGSLQCNMGKPVSPQTMKKDLKGITVYSMEKKQDGQMHVQVCGAITGQANVFEISAKDLKEADKKGFKLWTFQQ